MYVSTQLPLDAFSWNLICLSRNCKFSYNQTKLSVTWIPKCVLYCWQRRVSFFLDNALRIYYIVENYIFTSTVLREHTVSLPWQQWLRKRAALLRYTYLAYLFIATVWFRLSLVYFSICLRCVKTANIALLGIGHLNWNWKALIRNSG